MCGRNQGIVVSEENKNKHIVENKSRADIYQYHIDGEIITGTNGKRCDYIVEVQTRCPRAYIIELKGSDVNTAIVQIEATIARFHSLKDYDLYPRIILHKSRTHDVNDSHYRSFMKKYPNAVARNLTYTDTV